MTHVGIIGAGISGLTTAHALSQRGVPFTLLEADQRLGGVWHQKAYRECHLITSRNSTHLAEETQPDAYPDFPSAREFLEYIEGFAKSNGLEEHIRFGSAVSEATPEGTGWRVTTEGGVSHSFTHLVACTGLNQVPHYPDVPGERTGELIHSGDYRGGDQLRDKRVLVMGGGNSACDVAVEAGRVGTRSEISMRHARWIVPKYGMGIPITDMQGNAPFWAQRKFLELLVFMQTGRLSRFGLPEPDHRLFDEPVVMSQELPYMLKHGRVHVRPGVERFDGLDVVFTDGTRGTYDLIVTATGFRPDLSFLDAHLAPHGPMGPTSHRWLFCPEHPTLFLNGYYLNNGAFTQVANVSARLIAACVADPRAGKVVLEDMERTPSALDDGFVIKDRKRHIRVLETLLTRLA